MVFIKLVLFILLSFFHGVVLGIATRETSRVVSFLNRHINKSEKSKMNSIKFFVLNKLKDHFPEFNISYDYQISSKEYITIFRVYYGFSRNRLSRNENELNYLVRMFVMMHGHAVTRSTFFYDDSPDTVEFILDDYYIILFTSVLGHLYPLTTDDLIRLGERSLYSEEEIRSIGLISGVMGN